MKNFKIKKTLFLGLTVAGLHSISQNNYIPGLTPGQGNIGINLSSAPTTYNLEVGGSIGMGYGTVFGVTNPWPASQRKIFTTGWDGTNFDYLAFYTPGTSAASSNEKMRLTLGGNVGIGTLNPGAKLWVEDATASQVRVHTLSGTSKLTASNGIGAYDFLIDNTGIGRISSTTNILNFKNTGLPANPQVWIGTRPISGAHTDFNLAVGGKIVAQSIYVIPGGPPVWADYVFADDYILPKLEDVEAFYKKNKHLPEIPSTKDVSERGIDLGEMNVLLLKKLEELTLYVVEQKKEIDLLKQSLKK